MNKEIMKVMGFGKQIKLVEERQCPICKKPTKESDFKDSLSRVEYRISGLCQTCQDEVFSE